jgi:hypothetical protein
MQSECPVPAKRRRVGLICGAMTSCGVAAWALLTSQVNVLSFLALSVVLIGNVGVVFVGWPVTDGFLLREGRKLGRRNGGLPGRGLDGAARPAPAPAWGRPVLRAVARLMPPAQGRRWLAEADSLLFEVVPSRRAKAVRSYLLSAPRLLAMVWAGELSRRARRR